MCTAISNFHNTHSFGRTLDVDRSYGEVVIAVPRQLPLTFRRLPAMDEHYAFIGMAADAPDPLLYDGMNEQGLCVAGLNFPLYAVYAPADGIGPTPFELPAYLLAGCATVDEAEARLKSAVIPGIPYSDGLPLTTMHWMVADKHRCIVIESVKEGLKIHDNPTGVMANSPDFPTQLFTLSNYQHLSAAYTENRFASHLPMPVYAAGMGAMGLPGDWSSMSRFARGAFAVANGHEQGAAGTFRLLEAVAIPKGVVKEPDGSDMHTLYTNVCDPATGTYYVRHYTDLAPRVFKLAEYIDGDTMTKMPVTR